MDGIETATKTATAQLANEYISIWISPIPFRLEVAQQPDEGIHTTMMVGETLTVTSSGQTTALIIGKDPVEKKVNFGKLVHDIASALLVGDVPDTINVSDTVTVRSAGKKTIRDMVMIATLVNDKMVIIREHSQIVAVFEYAKKVAFITGTQMIKSCPVQGQQYTLVSFRDRASVLVGEPISNYDENFEFDTITCYGGRMDMTGPAGLIHRMVRCNPGELAYFRVMRDSIVLLDGFGTELTTRKFEN